MVESVTTLAASGNLEAQRALRDLHAEHAQQIAAEQGGDTFAYAAAVLRYEQAARTALAHPDCMPCDGGALASAIALAANIADRCGDADAAASLVGEGIALVEMLADGVGPEAELAADLFNGFIDNASAAELQAAHGFKRGAAAVREAEAAPIAAPPAPTAAETVRGLCTGLHGMPIAEAEQRLQAAEIVSASDAGARAALMFVRADWERRNGQPGNGDAALAESVSLLARLAQSNDPNASNFAMELRRVVNNLGPNDLALVSAHTPAALAVANIEGSA